MTQPDPPDVSTTGSSRRTRLLVGGVAVVVVVVVIVISLGHGGTAAPTAGASASAATSTAGPTPTGMPIVPSSAAPVPSGTPVATVAPGSRPTADVDLGQTATPKPQITAEITGIKAITGEAQLPGEVGGPALSITVRVHNATGAAVSLGQTVVNVYYGTDKTPAIALTKGTTPFPGSVAAGRDATGTYVAVVPENRRDDVTVELDLSLDSSLVLFRGPVKG